MEETSIKRLHWGCGSNVVAGWINSDRRSSDSIDITCDIRDGLKLDDESIDYVVSVHALQEVPYADLIPVLGELRRVLKANGVLRLVLPDLDAGIQAYLRGDRNYFLVPDDEIKSIGGKLIIHILWYGHSRTLFTYDFIEEILLKAGFSRVKQCGYKTTESSHGEIVELDNREKESLFVEAVK
jgi:SAM-dependent methyltransferase